MLYTTWDNNWWQADKATLDWNSEFDSWFSEGYENTRAVNVWKEGVDFVKNNLSDFVKEDGDGLRIYYKTYQLGPVSGLLPEYSQ